MTSKDVIQRFQLSIDVALSGQMGVLDKATLENIAMLEVAIKALKKQMKEKDSNMVEVVRCKDCRYKDTEDCPATERRMYRNNIGVIKEFLETWCGMEFCSNGKRRAK